MMSVRVESAFALSLGKGKDQRHGQLRLPKIFAQSLLSGVSGGSLSFLCQWGMCGFLFFFFLKTRCVSPKSRMTYGGGSLAVSLVLAAWLLFRRPPPTVARQLGSWGKGTQKRNKKIAAQRQYHPAEPFPRTSGTEWLHEVDACRLMGHTRRPRWHNEVSGEP